jgi:hypothetical protein
LTRVCPVGTGCLRRACRGLKIRGTGPISDRHGAPVLGECKKRSKKEAGKTGPLAFLMKPLIG